MQEAIEVAGVEFIAPVGGGAGVRFASLVVAPAADAPHEELRAAYAD